MTDKGFELLFQTIESGSGRPLTGNERDFWRMMLAGDEDKPILTNLVKFYRSGEAGKRKERIPAPGDLIEHGESMQTRAAVAWATCRKAIAEIGAYKSVRFADGGIAAAVEAMGGWSQLCERNSEELDQLAWQFERLYPGVVGTAPKVLAGYHEQNNQANGKQHNLDVPIEVPTLGGSMPLSQRALPEHP